MTSAGAFGPTVLVIPALVRLLVIGRSFRGDDAVGLESPREEWRGVEMVLAGRLWAVAK